MLDSACLSLARQVVDQAAGAIGPVATAGILPPEAYVSNLFWQFEKQMIFQREWLCVGHVNEVPRPGDHLPVTLLDEPLVLLRDQAGTVRVLSAICQHRGHPIFAGLGARTGGSGCLNGSALVCPYHNWSYGLDGQLIGAPAMRETTPLPRLREKIRLPQLRTEIFHGLVFINFDPDAPALAPKLGRLAQELATYPLADLVPTQTLVLQDLPWNWKLHHENAIEPYHTDYVHKGFHAAVPAHLTRFSDYHSGDAQIMRSTRFGDDGGDLFEAEGGRRLPEMAGLTAEQRRQVLFVSIMPNVFAVMQPSSVTMTILDPSAAGRLGSRRINLYPQAALAHPDFAQITNEQFDRNKILIMQDQVTLVALQQAYHSRFTPRGTLAGLEAALPQLNQWLVESWRAALQSLDAGQPQ